MALFNVSFPGDPDEDNDFQLLDISAALGRFPSSILSAWPRAHIYFRPNGERHLEEEDPVVGPSLEALFSEYKPDDIDDENAKVITGLIRQILKYERSERPSAAEILEHPWFKEWCIADMYANYAV